PAATTVGTVAPVGDQNRFVAPTAGTCFLPLGTSQLLHRGNWDRHQTGNFLSLEGCALVGRVDAQVDRGGERWARARWFEALPAHPPSRSPLLGCPPVHGELRDALTAHHPGRRLPGHGLCELRSGICIDVQVLI